MWSLDQVLVSHRLEIDYIYIPGQKYKTTLKNEEKGIVYNFWFTKIRYKYLKLFYLLNLKYEEISIHLLYVY